MNDLLPDGVVRRECPPCNGWGVNPSAPDGVCQHCRGTGRVTIETTTGALAHLVRCADCGLLARVSETALVDSVSVCDTCRKVQAARAAFFHDLYAPLGRGE